MCLTGSLQVDKAILIIRSYVAASTDWGQLWAIVKEEKKKGNPIANIIHRLKLEQNMVRARSRYARRRPRA